MLHLRQFEANGRRMRQAEKDPPIKGSPKGDKGKGDKEKTTKGKTGDSGKGKPQLNKIEAETTGIEERELKKQDSNATEPENEAGKQMEEFHKTVIKMLKEKERINNPMEELSSIIDTIKKTMDVKAKTIKIRKQGSRNYQPKRLIKYTLGQVATC